MFGLRNWKVKTIKKTVIEVMEDEIDELPYSDFYKATSRVFDKIDHGKAIGLP